jgi:hypothetical protein
MNVMTALPQGEHRFRYLADRDRWFTDFASNEVEHGRWGWNSVLVVPVVTTSDDLRIAA